MIKIIISPAKQMITENDWMKPEHVPALLKDAEILLEELKRIDLADLKKLLKANDRITEQNYQRFRQMDLKAGLSPALLSYRGLAFSSMAPQVFTDGQWEYCRKHLRILSGFYGILRPDDGIVPYRLEMQAKLSVHGKKNLYEFWNDQIWKNLKKEIQAERKKGEPAVLLNLASAEYSKTIEPFLKETDDIRYLTCVFGEKCDGKVKVKGTLAKMARGSMCAWLARNQVKEAEEIKKYQEMGFAYSAYLSDENHFVFLKERNR